jgi:filamentous hemagglutinin family protein
MTMTRATGMNRIGGWTRRMLQGAVMVAVAASVPAAWGAGGVQINTVAAGQASLTQQGSITTIRTGTRNTIINYQRFSVPAGTTLQFLQPDARSRVLNRIQGPEPSNIDGSLLSNGQVYIVNPAGVIFGAGAVVDVARVYASAGHISDANFLAGMNLFTENVGAVRNYGTIRASQIHLVGASVANFGEILTSGAGGIVTMTAGKDVYIGEAEGPTGNTSVLVKVSADKSATKDGTGVTNSGKVDAGKGAVYMGAGDLYAAGVYNNGTLRGANISLSANANSAVSEGTVDARNAQGKGGDIAMTGGKVVVLGGTVDASGQTGGGTIKIGGDFQGGSGLQASEVTGVAPGVTLRADALESGDGGQVIVWSDGITRFYGDISAVGGPGGGNGGFAEVSGKEALIFDGQVNLTALSGKTGTLLLDPRDITIVHGATASDDAELNDRQILFNDSGTSSDFSISDTKINSLAVGSVIDLAANRDITVSATAVINITSSNAITLTTITRDIILATSNSGTGSGASITTTIGNVTLNSGRDIILQAADDDNAFAKIITGTGAVELNAAQDIVLAADNSKAAAGSIATSGGAVTMNATGSIWLQSGTGAAASVTTGGGAISLSAGTSVTISGADNTIHGLLSSTGSGVGGAILLSAGDTTLGGASANDIIFFGNGAVVASGGGNITLKATDVNFNTGTDPSIAAGTGTLAFETNNGTNSIGLGSGSGSLSLTNANFSDVTSAAAIRIGADGVQSGAIAINRLAIASGRDLEINSNGTGGIVAVDDNNTSASIGIALGGNLTIRADSGGITVTQATNDHPEVSISGSGHTLTLVSAGGIGSSTNRFEIADLTSGKINVTNTAAGTADVFLTGLGTSGLTFGAINNSSNTTDVISAGDINATGVVSGVNVLLNASGGIGTSGAVTLAAGAGTLTTAGADAAGNITIAVAAGTLSGLTFVTAGSGTQTDTIDGLGDLAIVGALGTPAADNVVINASGSLFASGATITGAGVTLRSGTGASGNMDVSLASISAGTTGTVTLQAGVNGAGALNASSGTITGVTVIMATGVNSNLEASGATITGDVISLTAGTGSGSAFVTLTNATFAGATAAAPISVSVTQDADLTSIPALGTTSTLTVISFNGNATIGTQDVAALVVQAHTIGLTGNATVSGNMSLTGAVLLGGNTTLAGTGTASNLTVTGTIDGAGLTLTTDFTGASSFTGSLGAASTLGAFTVVSHVGGSVSFGSGSGSVALVSSGAVAIGEAATLTSNLTVTSGADVTFGSTIDSQTGGHFALTVNTGGTTWFQDDIGAGSATTVLGGVHTDAAGTTLLGNGTVASSMAIHVGSPITFDDDVTLAANTTLDAGTAGTVAFNKTLNSEASKVWTLTVNAGVSTTFADDVGAAANGELGKIVTTTGNLILGPGGTWVMKTKTDTGTNASATGEIDLGSTTTTLLANATLSAGSDVTVGGMLASGTTAHYGVAVLTTGDTQFSGGTSTDSTTLLGYILTDAGGTTKFGSGSPITVVTSGSQQYGDEVDLLANTTFKGSALAFNAAVTSLDASTFDLTLVSNAMSFAGAVTGSGGQLTLQPFNTSDNIVVGATASQPNTLLLGATDMANFSGFALTTIGYASGSGTLTVASGAPVFGTSTLLQMGSGTIIVESNVTANGSLGLTGGTINLGASLFTNGSGLTLQGATVLGGGGAITLNSVSTAGAAGNVTVIGSVNATGAEVLNIVANSTSGNGAIDIQGTIGAVTPLGGLNASGGNFTVHSNISTAGAINIDATQVLLAGSGTVAIVTGGNALNVAAPLDGDNTGTMNLIISTSSGGVAAPITLASIGATGTLNNLTLIATGATNGDISLADVTIHGALSGTGRNFTNSGVIAAHGISLTQSGVVDIGNDLSSAGFAVTVQGTVVTAAAGAPITGSIVSLTGTTGLVTLNDALTGTGAVSLTGVGVAINAGATVSGDTVALAGGAGNVTVSGVVNATNGFSSTSAGLFTLDPGAAIHTASSSVAINHTGALVTLNGQIAAGSGAVGITGAGVTMGAAGSIGGGSITINAGALAADLSGPVTATGPLSISGASILTHAGATLGGTAITLTATTTVQLDDTVTGTGAFASSGTAFTNNAMISAHGITINHTGVVAINGPLASAGFGVTVNGTPITVAGGAAITGSSITLTSVGPLAVSSAVTGTGVVSLSGTTGVALNVGAVVSGDTVALNGGTGNVTVSDVVNATHGFSSVSSGLFTLGGSGQILVPSGNATITHGGLVTLSGPVFVPTGTVSLTGAGVTQTGGVITAQALVLAGTGTFAFPMSNLITHLSVNITGPLSLTNATALNVTGLNTHGGALTLVNTSGNVTFSGTASAAAIALTASTVIVNATMSGTSLTVNGDLQSTAAITSTGNVTVTGSADVGAALTSTTGGINVTGTVSGTGSLAAIAGNITVGGSFSANGGATAGGAGFVSIGGPVLMTSGGTIAAGSSISLLNGANMTGNLLAGTTIAVTGDATIHGNVTAGTNIDFNNQAHVTGNLVATGGYLLFHDNATVSGNLSSALALAFLGMGTVNGNMTAGANIGFSNVASVNGDVVSTGGGITFAGNATVAGDISAHTTLDFSSTATVTGNMTAIGVVSFGGVANVTGNITSTTAGATFTGNATVDGNISAALAVQFLGTANLNGTVSAGTNLSIVGNATLAGSYTALNVSIPSAVVLAGNTTVNASGTAGITLGALGITGAGNLTLRSTSAVSSVTVGAIGTDGDSIGNLAINTDGLTVLGQSLFAHSVSFASAAGGALAAVPDHATIVNAGSLVIVSDTTFTIAENEKLTAYEPTLAPTSPGHATGSILIWAKSTSATALVVGDVNSTGRIILAAGPSLASPGTIVFHNRHAGAVTGGASALDLGADIFALGLISDDFVMPGGFVEGGSTASPLKFQGNIAVDNTHVTAPPSGPPRFLIGTPDTTDAETLWFTRSVENGATINSKLLFVNQFVVPTLAQFVDASPPNAVRDIEVSGVTRVPNAAVGTIVPRDVQTLSPERTQAISGALRDYLREVGIYARDLRTDELIDYLIGRGLYDDVPYQLNPDQGSYQVAVNRLPYAPVLPVVDAARKLLFRVELDKDGKPVYENGKPKLVSQTEDVAKAIGAAWQGFQDDTKIQSHKPAEFRAYLETHQSEDAKFVAALDYLNQIRDLLIQIKSLGLTAAEFEISRNKLLTKLRFANVEEKDFPEMIDGPSSQTSSGTVVTTPPASAPGAN